jgi:hypothetical protein
MPRIARAAAVAAVAALAAVFAWAWAAPTADAKFARPPLVPVWRLLINTRAYIKEHPKEAEAYAVHARINALAYELDTTKIALRTAPDPKQQKKEKVRKLPELHDAQGRWEPDGPRLAKADRKTFLHDGLEAYRKAIALDSKQALYHNGLGSLLVAGVADLAGPLKKGPVSPERRKILEEALNAYKHAFELDLDAALHAERDMASMIRPHPAMEAAQGIRECVARLHEEERYKGLLERILEAEKVIRAKPDSPITPVVLRLDGRATRLSELLEPTRTVRFDLDGDLTPETRPWVAPGTTFLVWDLGDDGRIDSGRELIGSVTWWIFWRDGYRMLDALDDDRDGLLTGAELAGLALWTDADADARTDSGELTTLDAAGIDALATRADALDGSSPKAHRGARRHGHWLPTWDWTLASTPALATR